MHRSSAVWESRKMLGNVQVFIGKYISHPLLFMEFLSFKHIYAVQLAVICLSELIFRLIILLPLEIFGHRVDLERALKSVASFQTGSIVFGIVSLFLAIIFCPFSWPVCLPVFVTYFISRLWCIVSIFIISLYMYIVNADLLPLNQSQSPMMEQLHFIRSDVGLDYGSGLASSYFYGYLKIVLPSTGEVSSKSIYILFI